MRRNPSPDPAPTTPAPSVGAPVPSDEAIVARVVAGEQALFELLLRRHNQRIYRTVRAILGRDDDVEDVMQDVYVRAFAHLAQFEGRARFSTWLVRIAVNEALGRRRRGGVVVPLPSRDGTDPMDRFQSRRETPEEAATRGELRETLRAATDALPTPLRVVFVLREVEGLPTADVAAALDTSEGAVKVRLHRARAALRGEIDRRLGAAAATLFGFAGARCDRVVAAVLQRLGLPRSPP